MPAPDLSGARWRTSSHSTDQANCVAVARTGAVVAMRDSKEPGGGVLTFSPAAWTAFTTAIRRGRFG